MVICDTNIISKLLQKNPDVVRNINNIRCREYCYNSYYFHRNIQMVKPL